MPVQPSDIKMFLSGGAGNSDPNASLGGVISTTEFVSATMENLFANVSSAEAVAGSVKYRCVYIHNGSVDSDLVSGGKYIIQESPSAHTAIDIGLGSAGINGDEQSVADEDASPIGVSFSHPTNEASKVQFGGDLTPDDFVPLWIRRTVQAGATSSALDNPITVVTGETA